MAAVESGMPGSVGSHGLVSLPSDSGEGDHWALEEVQQSSQNAIDNWPPQPGARTGIQATQSEV